MLIGGYLPCSLCDYPGQVAAVVFTQGCNFRCPFCHNGRLLPREAAAADAPSVDAVLERLRHRRGQLTAVVVSGGEPTLHADLPLFLARVRALGFAVQLDTNGSRPALLRQLLQARLLDAVALDIKAPWAQYARLTGGFAPTAAIRESLALLQQSGVPYRCRTTQVPALLSNDDLATIRAQLPPHAAHACQPFRAAQALDPRLRAA
jgi:pyruvate formate lyase activating enzyme